MTYFRFRYKRVGYMRWRCRTASRRAVLLVPPMMSAPQFGVGTAARRRTAPAYVPFRPVAAVLQVGQYVVGEEGDPQLLGHPDIRY